MHSYPLAFDEMHSKQGNPCRNPLLTLKDKKTKQCPLKPMKMHADDEDELP